jgi:hypothetical protein
MASSSICEGPPHVPRAPPLHARGARWPRRVRAGLDETDRRHQQPNSVEALLYPLENQLNRKGEKRAEEQEEGTL